jgi:hypothetical protein
MALTPGGGRSPSAKSPPPRTPSVQPRPPSSNGRATASSRVASYSVLRWGLLIGGLIIIVDLITRLLLQPANADDRGAIALVDNLFSWILFSILGIVVVRETGLFYLGAIAGVFAALIDAIVVAAAAILAPLSGLMSVEEIFANNLVYGALFAGVSGVVYALVQRWSGGRRRG